jgi:hypothetical protein
MVLTHRVGGGVSSWAHTPGGGWAGANTRALRPPVAMPRGARVHCAGMAARVRLRRGQVDNLYQGVGAPDMRQWCGSTCMAGCGEEIPRAAATGRRRRRRRRH